MMPNAGVRSRSYIARRAIPRSARACSLKPIPSCAPRSRRCWPQAERDAPQAPINILTTAGRVEKVSRKAVWSIDSQVRIKHSAGKVR